MGWPGRKGSENSCRRLPLGRAGGHPSEELQRLPDHSKLNLQQPSLQGNGGGRGGGGARTSLFHLSGQQKSKKINVATAKALNDDLSDFSLLGHLTLTKHVYCWYPHFTGRPQI